MGGTAVRPAVCSLGATWPHVTERTPASTLILIPAYNEAGRIGTVIQGVRRSGLTANVLVVDDGSADDTAAEARRSGAAVVSHPFNLGYGSALHTGYLFARRHGYRRLVQMDADGQHDAASLPALLEALDDGYDVVVGSRWLDGAAPATSLLRRIGSRLFAWIVTVWTGVPITDPTSGYQAISARGIEELAKDTFPEDYPDADVLIASSWAGLRLHELPVKMHPRRGGRSMHRGGRAAYYAYKMLLTLSLLPVRRKSMSRAGRGAEAAPR